MLPEQLRIELEEIIQERGYGYTVTGVSGGPSEFKWKKPPKGKSTSSGMLKQLDKVQKQYALANIQSTEKRRKSMMKQKTGLSPAEKTSLGKIVTGEPERRLRVVSSKAA